jgi:transcriptional regulator with XRE-family HTH domain
MSQLTTKQKKEWAKLLFLRENLTQKEIAERVSVTAATVSKWVNSEKWEELKVSVTLTREEQLKHLYRQLGELNKSIAERNGNRYPTNAEADTIAKLGSAIEKMETELGLNYVLSSFKEFLTWLRKFDLKEAQRLVVLFDDFVKSKLK